jgi:hypothetical protein
MPRLDLGEGWVDMPTSDPNMRVRIQRNPDNPNQWIVWRQTTVPSLVAEANAVEANANDGRRWGEGRVAARIPLHILYGKQLGEAFKDGDDSYLKKFLNDPDNAWMRTFRGRL